MMVSNDSISDISYTTAKEYATIIDPGEGIEQHGHCWSSETPTPVIEYNENKTTLGSRDSTDFKNYTVFFHLSGKFC